MTTAAEVAAHRFVLLGTRKRNGSIVSMPVWIADLGDGTVGFTTEVRTGKVKRIRNFPDVTIRPCDRRGRCEPDAPEWPARAEIREGAAAEPVIAVVKRRYGWQYVVIDVVGTIRGLMTRRPAVDCAIVLHLDPS